jgi:hypothetical protein
MCQVLYKLIVWVGGEREGIKKDNYSISAFRRNKRGDSWVELIDKVEWEWRSNMTEASHRK